jgi:hypothetical protein
MKSAVMHWARSAEKKYGKLPDAYLYRSLQPAAAEIIGCKFMRALGIGTAPSVEILETKEALRRDPSQWIFKPIGRDRLKVCAPERIESRWTLVVQKIPRAIPLSFLRTHYGIDTGRIAFAPIEDRPELDLSGCGMVWDLLPRLRGGWIEVREKISDIIWNGKAELQNAHEFFSDFVPPEDWSAVRRAIAWDSDQMLAIHAARLFLGMSIAHLSNVLVDPEGRLYSIDHEFCSATDGEELRILFDNVKPGTRASKALRGVAELTEEKLRELFDDLPVPPGVRWFCWPMGSREKTVEHYLERLRLWKQRFYTLPSSR